MRVAVDARELAGRPTGVGRYLSELLACWSREASAADVELALYAPEPIAVPPAPAGARGAKIVPRVVTGARGTMWEQAVLPWAVRGQADVLFCPAYEAPLLSPVPTVVAVHDVSLWAHPEWFRWREGVRRSWTSRVSAVRAARVLTLSNFSKAEITRWLRVEPARIVVTPLGVARRFAGEPRATTGRERGPGTVLFVGSLLNRRHLPDLVRAFAPIARSRADVRLIIVGDNRTWPREDPEAVAASLGVSDRVECRAYVSDQELAELYADAGAFAFLSTYEGYGLTPLEAMAAGVPVVAYDTPVAREVYGEAACLVPPGDLTGVTTALRDVLEREDTRAALRAAAARRLEGLAWSSTAALVLQALREAGSA